MFTVYIYQGLVGPIGDSPRYLSASFEPSWQSLIDRTSFTDLVFSFIRLFLGELQTHLFVSIFSAIVVFYLFRRYYDYVPKILFWISFLLPHFLVYSGLVCKESLAIPAFLLLTKFSIDLVVSQRGKLLDFCLGFVVCLLVRPNYLIAYIFLIFITFIVCKFRLFAKINLSFGVSFFVLSVLMFTSIVVIYLTRSFWGGYVLSSMNHLSREFFKLTDANTTRWYISWENLGDFFVDMWWGIPFSIIGPTVNEAIRRPILIPVFIEGIISLFLLLFNLFSLLSIARFDPRLKMIVVFGFIPSVMIGLLLHYPLGIFNPGSALRYKQSLTPLFYFYPLLLMAGLRGRYFRDSTTDLVPQCIEGRA